MNFLTKIKTNLDEMGLRDFTNEEIKNIIFPEFLKAIKLGTQRQGNPTNEDGGLLAIPTKVHLISKQEFYNVPIGMRVISCSYGGTNWVTSLVRKIDKGKVEIQKENTLSIPRELRRCTYNQFINRMADQIATILEGEKNEDFKSIGISLGFPHRNVLCDYGCDAYFLRGKLPKSWNIIDFEEKEERILLGRMLLAKLEKKYSISNFEIVYILNDTNSVAQEIPGESYFGELPVGFVFGTGSNAALDQWNLEAGKFIMPAKLHLDDLLNQKMIDLDLVHTQKKFIEHLHGGDYIRYRIACAVSILSDNNLIAEKVVYWLISQEDASIVSKFANGVLTYRHFTDYALIEDVEEAERTYEILKLCAKRALKQAGQTIGIMISAVVQAAGYTEGKAIIPVEGSVFWKGYKIQKISKEIIDLLLPENDITPAKASSIVGIAQLLMVHQMELA